MSTSATTAHLNVRRKPNGGLLAELSGDWLASGDLPGVSEVERSLGREAEGGAAIQSPDKHEKSLEFVTAGLGRWNTGLIIFLLKCHALCQQNGLAFRADTLPSGVAKLIQLSQSAPERADASTKPAKTSRLARIGEFALHPLSGAYGMLQFLGETVLALRNLLRGQAQFRRSDVWLVIQETGPKAIGIVALINFIIGLIMAFVGATQLRIFGASIYVADLVGLGTAREMGCLMTGIIMCGRTGAAFAAHLGTMKVNQEIEAYQTFGISPIEFLVLPRIIALVLMMPLLCLFADLISIAGGFLVSTMMLDITPALYLHRTIAAIPLSSFLLGIFKGAYFGLVIALTGCLRGIQCGTNAASVGLATTSAVVSGITSIIASDGVFAVICNALHI
jgi:phospholipid/cholesterol/gamma-HCH transport system permease protein